MPGHYSASGPGIEKDELSEDAVAQAGDARGFEHPNQLECGLTRLGPVEQALTRTEYHRGDLEIDLID